MVLQSLQVLQPVAVHHHTQACLQFQHHLIRLQAPRQVLLRLLQAAALKRLCPSLHLQALSLVLACLRLVLLAMMLQPMAFLMLLVSASRCALLLSPACHWKSTCKLLKHRINISAGISQLPLPLARMLAEATQQLRRRTIDALEGHFNHEGIRIAYLNG